jgi:hypothetical protein
VGGLRGRVESIIVVLTPPVSVPIDGTRIPKSALLSVPKVDEVMSRTSASGSHGAVLDLLQLLRALCYVPARHRAINAYLTVALKGP